MTLRKKILLINGGVFMILAAAIFAALWTILLGSFARLENEDSLQILQRGKDALSHELSSLRAETSDWAEWDEAYDFIGSASPRFTERNLPDATFARLRLTCMLFVDPSGRIVFKKAVGKDGSGAENLPEGLATHLAPEGLLLAAGRSGLHDRSKGVSGFLALDEGPMLVASHPILTSRGEGPSRGLLIAGRALDDTEHELLMKMIHRPFVLHGLQDKTLPPHVQDIVASMSSSGTDLLVRETDSEQIVGYALMADLYGKPAFLMQVNSPRGIHKLGRATLLYLVFSFILIALVFGFMAMMTLEKLVLSRLDRLGIQVHEIAASTDKGRRISLLGGDELTTLAEAINGMLETIDSSQGEPQDAAREREQLMHTLFDAVPVGILLIDASTRAITDLNPTAARMIGIDEREILGRECHEFVCPSQRGQCPIMDQGMVIDNTERLLVTEDGRRVPILKTVAPISIRGRLHLLESFVDISEHKKIDEKLAEANQELESTNLQLERAIEQAQDLAVKAQMATIAKSEFLARMSHEIRTPLNGLLGFTEMLLDSRLSEEQLDYSRIIKRSGEILLQIINDILDFSKVEAGQMDLESIEFDPQSAAYDVCELIGPRVLGRPVEVLCRIGDDLPSCVRGDPGRFRQVLANLMGNAAKFTDSGEIELAIGVDEEWEDRVRLHTIVRDTGIGISPEKLRIIFEAFQQGDSFITRRYGGSGLGLAISRQIAGLMNGEIWAESGSGRGCTFHFKACFEKAEDMKSNGIPLASLAGRRVLVVDDNRTNLDIVSHSLGLAGMRVTTLDGGEKVVAELLAASSDGDPYDLVVIDLQMPGMNGFDVAGEIRKGESAVARVPLLASSHSIEGGVHRSQESGFDGFLVKPAPRQKLWGMIARLLGSQDAEESEGARRSIITEHSLREVVKHSVNILLVEDNPANLKLAQIILAKGGYQVETATSGREAVAKYGANPKKYDLILMDVQMPDMDGLQATKAIRARGFHSVPVVAMTANVMKGDREKCLEAGMDDYVPKPIRREQVYEVIQKWLLGGNGT